MANRLLTVIGLQYLLVPLCRGWAPRQPSLRLSLYAGQGWSPIREGCWQNALKARPLNLINILIVFPNLVAAHEGDTAR